MNAQNIYVLLVEQVRFTALSVHACMCGLKKKKLKPRSTLVAPLSVPVTLNFLPLASGVSVFVYWFPLFHM
jgi:hypothetical protein